MMGQSLNKQLIFRSQWALCMIPSDGTKSTMLDGKRMQHSPKQSDFHQPCKGPIEGLVFNGTVVPCQ